MNPALTTITERPGGATTRVRGRCDVCREWVDWYGHDVAAGRAVVERIRCACERKAGAA